MAANTSLRSLALKIREAEKRYDELISASKKEAEKIISEAKAKVAEDSALFSEFIAKKRHELFKSGEEKISLKEKAIISKAKKKASSLLSRKLSDEDEMRILNLVLNLE